MVEQVKEPSADRPSDIVFECPQCGKSLAIDERGAGYLVVCPDCGHQIQVPGIGASAESASEDAEEGASVGDKNLEAAFDDLRERCEQLERLHSNDRQRFEQISGELVLIQASLDRLVSLMQDANAPQIEGSQRDEME